MEDIGRITEAVYVFQWLTVVEFSYGLIIRCGDISDMCSGIAGNEHQKSAESAGQTSRIVPELPEP